MKNFLKSAKYISVLLLLAGICFSCIAEKNVNEESEDCLCNFNFSHDGTASIIGKWKLEKIRVISRLGTFCTDYSKYNVVYEFKHDGILTVSSGNSENHGWHESGEYSFIKDEWGMSQDGYPWGLNINKGSTNWYILSSKELIIDYSPGDGATYYFVKIGN